MFQAKRISTATTMLVAPANGGSTLWTVNVNTGAAGAVLTIYRGTDATGTVIAVIDASTKSSHTYGVLCDEGIFVEQTVGAADITIGHT